VKAAQAVPLQRVMVTGGAGYIGSHLVDSLCDAGHEVSILDDLSSGRFDNVAARVRTNQACFIRGSILDADLVDRAVKSVDLVYHLAAAVGVPRIVADPLGSLRTNVLGVENILAACARHDRKVVMASSSEVYGKTSTDGMAEDDDRLLGPTSVPRWSYAAAKALDEHLAFSYAGQGLRVVIVRYFNSYGPRVNDRENASVVGTFLRRSFLDEPLLIHGDGHQRRCFTYVDDTVRGTVLAGSTPGAEGSVYNIGTTTETSVLELAESIVTATHSASALEFVPYGAIYGDRFEDVLRRVPDICRAREILGWESRVTLAEGLARTIEWWRSDARAA